MTLRRYGVRCWTVCRGMVRNKGTPPQLPWLPRHRSIIPPVITPNANRLPDHRVLDWPDLSRIALLQPAVHLLVPSGPITTAIPTTVVDPRLPHDWLLVWAELSPVGLLQPTVRLHVPGDAITCAN